MENWPELPGVDVHVFETLASTQDYVLPLARQRPERPILCVAHHQTQGRGRGNKTWQASAGAVLCFSLCVRIDLPLHALGGVTLAFGVALCHALEQLGAQGLRLKWPNDIHGPGGKLAGILTEVFGEPDGPAYLVVGVGVNIDVPADAMADVKHAWTDLRACHVGANDLLVPLVNALLAASTLYEREGFAPFHASYDEHDLLKDKRVSITVEHKNMEATVLGVSASGALLIDKAPFSVMSGSIAL